MFQTSRISDKGPILVALFCLGLNDLNSANLDKHPVSEILDNSPKKNITKVCIQPISVFLSDDQLKAGQKPQAKAKVRLEGNELEVTEKGGEFILKYPLSMDVSRFVSAKLYIYDFFPDNGHFFEVLGYISPQDVNERGETTFMFIEIGISMRSQTKSFLLSNEKDWISSYQKLALLLRQKGDL